MREGQERLFANRCANGKYKKKPNKVVIGPLPDFHLTAAFGELAMRCCRHRGV